MHNWPRYQGKKEEARSFYSSLFLGDIILAAGLGIVLFLVVAFLEKIIVVPCELIKDVKITFFLTFLCFLLRVIETAFTAGAYVAQRMDLYAVRQIIYNVIRAAGILALYSIFEPKIFYISLATAAATIANIIMDYSLTKKLLPDLKIKVSSFKRSCITSLVSSGIWYSIISLGGIIANGLDLLITNQYVGSYYMGILAVSKTVTSAISKIRSSIVSVFNPSLMKSYAEGTVESLGTQVKKTMRVTSFILNVPLACLAVYARVFYKVWLPEYTADEIQMVTVLTILGILAHVVNANAGCIGEICALVNKLKVATWANLTENVLSLGLTFCFLYQTKLGVYAVAGVSSIVSIIYFITFVFPYMAKLLDQKKKFFFPTLFRGLLDFFILIAVYSVISDKISVNNWLDFGILIFVSALIGYIVSFILCFKGDEKKQILKWRK